MQAYHNDPELKANEVMRSKEDADADRLTAGSYGKVTDNCFKGCSVGCDAFYITGEIQSSPHKTTSDYFGFPVWIEELRDGIFEGLPEDKRNSWHQDYKEAIPVGLDEEGFSGVKAKFLNFVINNNSINSDYALASNVINNFYAYVDAAALICPADAADAYTAYTDAYERYANCLIALLKNKCDE